MSDFNALASAIDDTLISDAPPDLGRGFSSLSGLFKARLFRSPKATMIQDPTQESYSKIVRTRSDYSKFVTWSARAKFGAFRGDTTLRTESARAYKTSKHQSRAIIMARPAPP